VEREEADNEDEEEGEEEAEEAEEEEEDDDSDSDIDFDGIAEQAVKTALDSSAAKRMSAVQDLCELSLDVGVGPEQLYLSGPQRQGTGKGRRGAAVAAASVFDTAAPPGIFGLDARDFAPGPGAMAAAPKHSVREREVRGAPVRPVDDSKLRRKEAKLEREERLEGWFGMRKRVLTPELEKELKAIKLRANFDPKRFYKAQDSKELPKYFTIATETGGGLAAAGVAAEKEVRAHSGRSLLDNILRDEKVKEWTTKKWAEVGARGMASVHSGHGLSRGEKKGGSKRSTKRGGNWKKTKRT